MENFLIFILYVVASILVGIAALFVAQYNVFLGVSIFVLYVAITQTLFEQIKN